MKKRGDAWAIGQIVKALFYFFLAVEILKSIAHG